MVRSSYNRAGSVPQSFGYALQGVKLAWQEERNFRVQCAYALFVLLLILSLRPALAESLVCLLSVGCLLACEVANSALERVVDLVSPGEHPLAGQSKDMSAAAVMIVSLVSAGTVFLVTASYVKGDVLMAAGGLLCWMMWARFRGGIGA